jgi:hypothetical protein
VRGGRAVALPPLADRRRAARARHLRGGDLEPDSPRAAQAHRFRAGSRDLHRLPAGGRYERRPLRKKVLTPISTRPARRRPAPPRSSGRTRPSGRR